MNEELFKIAKELRQLALDKIEDKTVSILLTCASDQLALVAQGKESTTPIEAVALSLIREVAKAIKEPREFEGTGVIRTPEAFEEYARRTLAFEGIKLLQMAREIDTIVTVAVETMKELDGDGEDSQ